jgi:hypothetical protein
MAEKTLIDGLTVTGNNSGVTVQPNGVIVLNAVNCGSGETIFDNCFWGLFEDYLVVFDLVYSQTNYPNINLLGTTGSKPAGNWCSYSSSALTGASVVGGSGAAATFPTMAAGGTDATEIEVSICSPWKAQRTSMASNGHTGAARHFTTMYYNPNATDQQRGFTIGWNGVTTAGTVSGTMKLFGIYRGA